MSRIVHPQDLGKAAQNFKAGCAILLIAEEGVWASDQHWQTVGFDWWQGNAEALGLGLDDVHYVAEFDGQDYFAIYLESSDAMQNGQWQGLRQLLPHLNEAEFELLGRASQICQWDRNHRFCGHCGHVTHYHPKDRARACDNCGLHSYPRISPCIIVLVSRGEYCLLARHQRYKTPMFSCLAGFIEAGESAEQCVSREVFEEVGITVHELTYQGSQSWPFPGQLMLGFRAEYKSGDILIDEEEIAEAGWYHYSQLPLVPPRESISGQLIQEFVDSFS
ncbi:NAD(+) diphosphatase [Pseudoteredinibacter isoporae]|uniref:NAD(+) diphosphatase n=1 Tax=Pseudoteredinibacter isoporae TaxID=570281 RepID=A0A7X0MZJ2_9GAMM|nr:NAD(+) diphosphatase [Pseudoteredinibacter isoporae]MBB6523217.1 NAD+ diphosphatase [Pseudoteredinibacter isoporae]NHO88734.1 NAD(+) diphosphatase [Pseudoteredinibacter isoporae]NIB22575.1 NAD(+) diphosphatase [Pseudoteredinibacter isoporae]